MLGIPALAVVFCFIKAEQGGHVSPLLLMRVGDASYSIYLSHVLSLSAIGRVWASISTDRTWEHIFMLALLLAAAIGIGFLSYFFIEKPLLSLTRKVA